MSVEVKKEQESAAPPADELKNLKAEVARKMGNIEQTNAALKASQEALLAEIQKLTKPAQPAAAAESLSDLMYRDPEAYAKKVLEQADARADARISQVTQAQEKQNRVISSIAKEYPEITNGDHELTLLAVEKYEAMDKEEKTSPAAYKAAVAEAAAELGIKPRSKRPKESDDYVGGGGGSSGGSRSPGARKRNELDPRTAAFAEAVGLDLSKPEVKERLINNHGRETYTKWK